MDKEKSLKEMDSPHKSINRGSLLNVDQLRMDISADLLKIISGGRANPVHVRMYSNGAVFAKPFTQPFSLPGDLEPKGTCRDSRFAPTAEFKQKVLDGLAIPYMTLLCIHNTHLLLILRNLDNASRQVHFLLSLESSSKKSTSRR